MSPHRAALLFALVFLLGAAAPLLAQDDDEMVTDRPDQSESTAIVGRGVFQLETGFSFERDESPGVVLENTELFGSLIRWGLSDQIELRFAFAAYTRERVQLVGFDESAKGFADPELGVKWRFREGDGASPAIALIAATSLPVGGDDLTTDEFDPTLRIAFDHDLTDTLSLGWNVGYTRDGFEEQDYALYSASFGVAVDDRWGTFYELFGTVALGGDADDAHSFDTGITLMLNDDLQADVWAGLGINDEAPDAFVGLGLSWRVR